jgi:hypothetical protein
MTRDFRALDDRAFAGRAERVAGWDAESYRRIPPERVEYFDPLARNRHGANWDRLEERLPTGGLWRMRDVVVRGKGLITIDGVVVRNNLEGISARQVEALLEGEQPAQERVGEPMLYTTRYGIRNYGHCLTDILPRSCWAASRCPGARVAVHAQAPAALLAGFHRMGLDPARFSRPGDEAIAVDELWFVDLWNRHPLGHSARIHAFLRELHEGFRKERRPSTGRARKLYVGRGDATTRRIVDESALVRHLARRGFHEVRCGAMTLEEQIATFEAADEIVGIAGAALTNLVFCAPGTRVTMMVPATMNAGYFWDLACHGGQRIRIGYFPVADESRGIHADFLATPAQVDRLLD